MRGAVLLLAGAFVVLVSLGGGRGTASVYEVDAAQDPIVAGAAANHAWCLHYSKRRPLSLACQDTGQALKRRALEAERAIRAAVPIPNRTCTEGLFVPAQVRAHRAALRAGAGRSLRLMVAWRTAERGAENVKVTCIRRGFR